MRAGVLKMPQILKEYFGCSKLVIYRSIVVVYIVPSVLGYLYFLTPVYSEETIFTSNFPVTLLFGIPVYRG